MTDGKARRVRVHGHRGARARLPENTLPGFEYAIALGVDALEMDLVVTKDDVLVVAHDPVLDPSICTGPRENAVIRELTLAELRQWDCGAVRNPQFPMQKTLPGTPMPMLDEVFQLAGRGRFDYHVELKSFPGQPQFTPPPKEFARMVLDQVRRYRLEERIAVLSFDFRVLAAMRRIAPEIRLAALAEADARDFAAIAHDAGDSEIVSPEFPLVTSEKVQAAHAAGIQIVPWTANTPRQWEQLIHAGVDAIVTDDPEALIGHLQMRGLLGR